MRRAGPRCGPRGCRARRRRFAGNRPGAVGAMSHTAPKPAGPSLWPAGPSLWPAATAAGGGAPPKTAREQGRCQAAWQPRRPGEVGAGRDRPGLDSDAASVRWAAPVAPE